VIHLTCGGIVNDDFTANLLTSERIVKIGQLLAICRQDYSGSFLTHRAI